MKIRYRDLSVQDKKLKTELLASVERVLSHGMLVLGPEVQELEKQLAEYCQKKYAVCVNSGTDAVYFALRSLDIGPQDEVITTPLTWVATTNAIVLCGAKPVFVDIKDDLNMDEDLVESCVTKTTKAIMPVHFTGKLCNLEKLQKTASKHNLFLIEDAAQAFGARDSRGRPAGSFGIVNAISLNPMKILNAYGEAGVILTDDLALYDKLLSLRYAGTINKEDCHYPSFNGRIDTIQAAMILVNMCYLEERIARFRQIAKRYTKELKDVVQCPDEQDSFHVYYSYTIVTQMRDELKTWLAEKGIETKVQHPVLMPNHTAYKGKFPARIPRAEMLVKRILCLPNAEHLSDAEVDYVISSVRGFFKQ